MEYQYSSTTRTIDHGIKKIRSCTSIGILVSSDLSCFVLCLNLTGQKNWSFGCNIGYEFFFLFRPWMWILHQTMVLTFDVILHHIWPARMSRSIRSALYVPGSSLKSSLNIEYALQKKACRKTELIQSYNQKRRFFTAWLNEGSTLQLIRLLVESYASRILRFFFQKSPSYWGFLRFR